MNRKESSFSSSFFDALDKQENWNNSPDPQNVQPNSALESFELNNLELDKLSKNAGAFSLIKAVKVSDKATQTEAEFLPFQRKSISPELQTVVEWRNLEVEVTAKGETKKILNNISGQASNLEILAILGPSGAGKSTLLNVIAGRISNFNGTAKFFSNAKRIGFAYVPQVDQLAPYLTVRESLLFASKFKNSADTDHEEEVDFVIDSFNLHTIERQYASKCSGGERKRLSIGLEMISRPKILLLDEPTTGLDSTTAYAVIEVLKKIHRNTAVITTIHQPNTNLFQLFDLCYILTDGKCIYNGPPSDIVDHLQAKFHLLCPKFTNPADWILDIANETQSEQGSGLIRRMAQYEQEEWTRKDLSEGLMEDKNHSAIFWDTINQKEVELREINRSSLRRKYNFWREYYLNVWKLFLDTIRDPLQFLFRALSNALLPFVLWVLMAKGIGFESGCTFLPLNGTHVQDESTVHRFTRRVDGIQALGTAFVNLMTTYFNAQIPATLTLVQLIRLLKKENLNAYYSPDSYFAAILTISFVLGSLYATINTVSFFYWTQLSIRLTNLDKMLQFFLIFLLTCVLGDMFGLFTSIAYPEQAMTAIVVSGLISFIFFFFSGYFVPVSMMGGFVKQISEFAFARHLFEALVRALYGGNKCRLDDHMLFSLEQANEFIKLFNYETQGNLSALGVMPLKVKNALKQSVWNRSTITELVVSINDLDAEQLKEFDNVWDSKTNFVLNSFGLFSLDATQNYIVLFTTLALVTSACYFFFSYRLKK